MFFLGTIDRTGVIRRMREFGAVLLFVLLVSMANYRNPDLRVARAATTVTFQQGVSGYSGTSMKLIGGGSYGGAQDPLSTEINVRNTDDPGNEEAGLLYFDLSSIPAGSVIQSASLDLYVTYAGGTNFLKTQQILDPDNLGGAYPQGWAMGNYSGYVNGTVPVANLPARGQVDIHSFSGGAVKWKNSDSDPDGANVYGVLASPSDTKSVTSSGITSLGVTSDVQSWIETGATINEGWAIVWRRRQAAEAHRCV